MNAMPKLISFKLCIIDQEFIGEKDSYFCGVFDGHGPQGHKVARYVRDTLPSKLSSASKSHNNGVGSGSGSGSGGKNGKHGKADEPNPHFSSSWKSTILKSFQDMDDDLQGKPTIDSYCSGTTAVTIIKQVIICFDRSSHNELTSCT